MLFELGNMTRRRVHASAELDGPSRLHPEALGKVDKICMVADELHTAQWYCLALPTGDGGVERGEVGRQVLLESGLMFRIVQCQTVRNGTGHGLPTHRIEVDMWVASGVLVTERPIDACRHFQWRDIHRAIDIAWGRRQDLRVPRCLQQPW